MGSLKKFYVVKVGRKTGIFNTWEECKEQINGFSGAKFKGFNTKEEAEAFFSGAEKTVKCEAYAYTDGSYNEDEKMTGGGGIIYLNGNQYPFITKTDDADFVNMRNVGGEILAAMAAVEYAKELGINSLCIFHDYEGVGSWAKGDWKTNKVATKGYAEFMKSCDLSLDYKKVEAHSGVEENEEADDLAKYAVGVIDNIEHNYVADVDFTIQNGKYNFKILYKNIDFEEYFEK